MLSDEDIDKLVAATSWNEHPEELAGAAVGRSLCCPACHELFLDSQDLKDHLARSHNSDLLARSSTRRVSEHEVKQGASKIYICTYCGFAVSTGGMHSVMSCILDHIERCAEYKKAVSIDLNAHKTYRVSTDADLTRAYLNGQAEIEFLECMFCKSTFGQRDRVVEHVAMEHADAGLSQLSDAERERFVARASNFIAQLQRQLAESDNEGAKKPHPTSGLTSGRGAISRRPTRKKPASDSPRPKQYTASARYELLNKIFSRTISAEEILHGTCVLTSRMRTAIGHVKRVKVQFVDSSEPELSYEWGTGKLFGLDSWYLGNAIEAGDRIRFRLDSIDPPRILLWTEWERNLDQLLKCPPEDFAWEHVPVRDILVFVLAHSGQALNCAALYAEISKHCTVARLTIIAVLSRYRGILFQERYRGKWELLREGLESAQSGRRSADHRSRREIHDQVAADSLVDLARDIKESDMVYKLLHGKREDMSQRQICQKLADHFGIDWQVLERTDFFDATDPRLERLSSGNFGLKEWMEPNLPLSPEIPSIATTVHPPQISTTFPAVDDKPSLNPTDVCGVLPVPADSGPIGTPSDVPILLPNEPPELIGLSPSSNVETASVRSDSPLSSHGSAIVKTEPLVRLPAIAPFRSIEPEVRRRRGKGSSVTTKVQKIVRVFLEVFRSVFRKKVGP